MGTPGNAELTQRRMYEAAASLIAERGYEAVSLRQLAGKIGIKAGSLYNHISSKQELLFNILTDVMTDLISAFKAEIVDEMDPARQLHAFVRLHINYHIDRIPAVVIASSELRSLEPDNYKRIVNLRIEYDRCVQAILKAGVRKGVFNIENVRLCEYAIIAMLTGICMWYKPRSAISREALIENYQGLVFKMVGAEMPSTP